MNWEVLFNIGSAIGIVAMGVYTAVKTKRVERKIPTDETKEQAEQALRDRINRELGVQLDARDKRIKALEESDKAKQVQITTLEHDLKGKEREINVLNQQVSRLEREHEQEETERKAAELRANEAEKNNVSLITKLEIYETTLKVIQETVARPMHITLSIDGILAHQKTQVETVTAPIASQ